MKNVYFLLIALLATEIILGFICAPHSCDWGNTVFFYAGIVALFISLLLAILQTRWSGLKRIGFGLLFILITAIVWIACFMFLGFNLICRMF
jgi:hypothetical protein